MLLDKNLFKPYIDKFNNGDEEIYSQYIDNKSAWSWIKEEVPFFECSDKDIEETYYFRWWTYRKHIKDTPVGFIISEFLPEVDWAGIYNTINAATMHHLYEGRWLKGSKTLLKEYCLFWFNGETLARSYSAWFADSIWNYCKVTGEYEIVIKLLPKLIDNFYCLEKSNLHECGLFWSSDDRDAMEMSISGPGIRPTLNSYMYGEAAAISEISEYCGIEDISNEFSKRKKEIKDLVEEKLWDKSSQFFKVIPLCKRDDKINSWNFNQICKDNNVKELLGFIPWYFNLPDSGYENAWEELLSKDGFHAPYGLTSAEQRHDRFMFRDEHECLWNGPSWPFATSQTLTAMANLLNNYSQNYINKENYFNEIKIYAKCHKLNKSDGSCIPWIDENLDPYTGEWISRNILSGMRWRKDKGGYERGKDYNHSTYCDLIISGLVGLRPRKDNILEVNPLVPEGRLEYFCIDDVKYHDKNITIVYDKTGEKYKSGKGLRVYINNKEVAYSIRLEKLCCVF